MSNGSVTGASSATGAAIAAWQAGHSVVAKPLPIVAVAFIMFLVTGVALPVLPLHVHRDLKLGTFVAGLVAGAQFAAALLSRSWSVHCADCRGAKRTTEAGQVLATEAGLATSWGRGGVLRRRRALLRRRHRVAPEAARGEREAEADDRRAPTVGS